MAVRCCKGDYVEFFSQDALPADDECLGRLTDMLSVDEITDFSELGRFIDVPVRNYSSGMLARLAFSIASIVVPEILIVDEILSVGDEDFQVKSKAKMMELMGGGTTVLFVSHDLQQIRDMCTMAVWLDGGRVMKTGAPDEVCDAYLEKINVIR